MADELFKLGFIGGGAMAEALISGTIANNVLPASSIYVSELRDQRVEELKDRYGVNAFNGADSFIGEVDMIILAVKPQVADKALEQIAGKMDRYAVVASIVAGLKLEKLESYLKKQPVIRVMPTTPLSVGAGRYAFAMGSKTEPAGTDTLLKILSACGKVVEVNEGMLDAVTGLSGSGPAYGFLMIDALADGGVAAGLPRQTAILLAAQTLLGAAKMVLDTGKHPDQLRDQVTSPAGTTIAGVRVMEQQGVRGALIDAVIAATERSQSLGK